MPESLQKDLTVATSWFKIHEKLLIVAMIGLVFYGSINKVETVMLKHAETKSAITQQELQDQKTANAELAKEIETIQKQYDSLRAELDKQNAALAVAVAQRNQAVVVQQEKDKTLPPDELSQRWAGLIGGASDSVRYGGSDYSVSPDAAVATVTTLEQVAPLQANLKDENTTIQNQAQELAKSDKVVSGLNDQIDGLKSELKDSDKACQAQITEVKRKARVSKLRWFGIGVGAGAALVARIFF